jgi:hypothetical protein
MCSAVFSKRLQELQWLDRILFKMLQAQSVIFSDGFSEKNPCWINVPDFHKLPAVSIHFFIVLIKMLKKSCFFYIVSNHVC